MPINIMGYGLKTLANPSTAVTLKSGQGSILPSGQYFVMPGAYTALQYWDTVSLCWRTFSTTPHAVSQLVVSDGSNYRLYNPTGTVVGGVVTNGGTANTAKNGIWAAGSSSVTGVVATTTAGAETGTSAATFNVIVGGEINTSVTIVSGGSGYVLPPVVTFDPPPAGGLRATGYATLTAGGAVTSVTVTNQGAGYTSTPNVTLTPAQGDTTGSGAVATAAIATANSGKIVAVTMATGGSGYTSVPTITPAGLAGSPAITAIMCFAVTTAPTVTAASGGANGYQLELAAGLTGGSNTTTNPAYTTGLFSIRNGLCAYGTSATFASQVLLDGGLSQIDHSNLGVFKIASTGTVAAATTFASGAVGGVTDVSFVIPV